MTVLSFKEIHHAYLLETSTAQNKNLIHLLNLLINCISAISDPRILSIKGEYTFLSLNFIIIGFCNYSATFLLDIMSFLNEDLFRVTKVSERASIVAPPENFLSKYVRSLKQVYVDIH